MEVEMTSKEIEEKDLEWWLASVESAYQVGNSWKAICPAHNDVKASLSLTPTESGVLVHCFAGCGYDEILGALNGSTSEHKITIKRVGRVKKDEVSNPWEWWVEYTGVPKEVWEDLQVEILDGFVTFHWPGVNVTKRRKLGGKEFSWKPQNSPSPPLWPYPTKDLVAQRVFLCEGETDTAVLRYIGLPAFGLTKGVNTPLEGALAALKGLGVKEVVAVLDADTGGQSGLEKLRDEGVDCGLSVLTFPTGSLVDPLSGEKDLRDYWLRVQDPEIALNEVLKLIPEKVRASIGFVSLDQFMAVPQEQDTWLIEDIWLSSTIGMIAGYPKMYKSWLGLDLGLSIASGTPFLNTFSIHDPGPVVLVPKEDPNFLLQDRIVKILASKGLGGISNFPHLQFPERGLPFYLDLTREFFFTPDGSRDLFDYLDSVADRNGRIRAVILDPILRMLLGIDEYKASEVSESVFTISSEIQKRYQAAVVLIHHRSKGGAETGKRSYGSIAFHAFSESALYLKGEEPDADGWIEVEGQYKSSQPTYWSYRFPELQPKYRVETRRKGEISDLREGILEILNKVSEGCTPDELLEVIPGASSFLTQKMLKKLEEDGEIEMYLDRQRKSGPSKRRWRLIND